LASHVEDWDYDINDCPSANPYHTVHDEAP
jgi:hypothetical protein